MTILACSGTAYLIARLLNIYVLVLFGRVILSWFPLNPGTPMATVYSFLYTVTEPVLGPVRRAIPAMGGFDFSPIVVFFGLQILATAICR